MNLRFLKILFFTFFLTFNLSCSSQEIEKTEETFEKVLIDIGDSLTAGAGGDGNSMSKVASDLLGEEWIVKNMGVGGENTLTIGARHGGIPMYIKESITIPKDGSKVEISSGLYSSYNNKNVLPLLQGSAGINPCRIDTIQCKLTRNQNKYFINRITPNSTDYKTKENSTLFTSLSSEKKGILTIFIGQNGGYSSPNELLNQIDLFVKHKGDENVIIITSHGNSTTEIVQLVSDKYQSKYIDLRKYMTTKAIYDAIEFGLLPDNGEYPTSEDLERMGKNYTPKTLLKDGIHFNSIGYELLGRIRYKKGKELGYW
jgi:lysophospholipase L1-like esterase